MLRSSRTGLSKIGTLSRATAVIVGALVALFGVIAGPLLGVFAATPASAATTGSGYTAITPYRALGSTAAGTPVVAGTPATVQITGTTVPAGATAAVLDVTVSAPTAAGYLEVYPTGSAPSTPTSNVNFTAGETVANLVTVPLSSSGAVSVLNYAGTANVDVDVEGYYSASGTGLYNPITPNRVSGALGTSIGSGATTAFTVTGGNVPSTATAVVVNLTASGGTASSYLSAYAAGVTNPPTATSSSLNFNAGETVANRDIVNVGTSGQIEVYNLAGTVDVDVDVDGYYAGTGSTFVALSAPVRVADTRAASVVGTQTSIASGATEAFNLTTTASGIPASATAVAANFTVVPAAAPSAPGYISVFPTGVTGVPNTSDVNWPANSAPVANFTQADTAGTSTGSVQVYNYLGSPADLVVDAFGYFTTTPSNQTYTVSPTTPQNVTVSSGSAGTATATQGDILYTATGLGTTPVDIELFSAADVSTLAGTSFTNTGGVATQGTVAADITVVNGTPQSATQINNVTPIAGTVTFTVNSTTSESDYPVVFAKAATNNALATSTAGVPSQAFGVGGEATWSAAAATNGAYTTQTVTSVNAANGTFQAGGTPTGPFTFTYNATSTPPSTYTYSANATTGTFGQSEAAFAAELSPGTVIAPITYNSAGPSAFTITVNPPLAPTAVTAAYSATATPAGVVVTWTAPPNPDVATYTVLRATVTAGVVGTYGTTVASGVTALTATDTAVTAGSTYSYEVEAVGTTGNGTGAASLPAQATVPASTFNALASAPVSLTTLVTPVGTNTSVTTGDVLNTTFNQPIAVTAGATVTLANTTTEIGTLTNGVNATFTVTGAGLNVLSIKVTAPPAFSTGTVLSYTGLAYTGETGITGVVTSSGAGGFNWDLAAADGTAGTAVQGNQAVPSGTDTIVAPRVLDLTAGTFNNTTGAPTIVVGTAGSALPGATVTVTDTSTGTGHLATGTAVAAANGSWSVTLSGGTGTGIPATGDTLSATETILQEGSGNGTSVALTATAVG
jgi:hypothetical protein